MPSKLKRNAVAMVAIFVTLIFQVFKSEHALILNNRPDQYTDNSGTGGTANAQQERFSEPIVDSEKQHDLSDNDINDNDNTVNADYDDDDHKNNDTKHLENDANTEASIKHQESVDRKDYLHLGNNSTSSLASLQSYSCPPNSVYMKDRVPKLNETLQDRKIPRTVHFLVRSRCVPSELAVLFVDHWENVMIDHSFIYHGQEEIDMFMSSEKHNEFFPSISSLYHCARHPRAKQDLARLLILWEYGGVSMEVDNVPGPEFLKETMLDSVDNSFFEVNGDWEVNLRFLASRPNHLVMVPAIMRLLSDISILDRCHEKYCSYGGYGGLQKHLFLFLPQAYTSYDRNNFKEFRRATWHPLNTTDMHNIMLLNTNRTEYSLFESFNLSNTTREAILFNVLPDGNDLLKDNQCVDYIQKDPFASRTNITSLIETAGEDSNTTQTYRDNACPDDLIYATNKFDPRSIVKGRKIPKIVHLTSKSKCFTQNYIKNLERWRFPEHSFFVHDDAAMEELFSRDWPEFPLLHQVLPCLKAGAAKADLWRYLALWEYGGIYTDIDNSPGPMLLNGTIITDDMDSFLEVEIGRFPSQYFLACEYDMDYF